MIILAGKSQFSRRPLTTLLGLGEMVMNVQKQQGDVKPTRRLVHSLTVKGEMYGEKIACQVQ